MHKSHTHTNTNTHKAPVSELKIFTFVVQFYLLSSKLCVIFAYVEPLISLRSLACYLWLVNLQVSKLLIPREYTLPWLSEVFCLKHSGGSSYPRWISRILHHLLSPLNKGKNCMLQTFNTKVTFHFFPAWYLSIDVLRVCLHL